ncbi:hypothetical protein GQX73_g6807 [Xylaria multiplex]|uniref:RRM domain-containing protein n=1 Tax=Xylaria multiplex TaxID=323545 RepID=A0A7C8MNT9_9PEZI|nr:hypothetical protein GQX73_g6807 [Xylaria multiplex]
MAPKYPLYSGFTVTDAMRKAGEPGDPSQFLASEPPVEFFTHPPDGSAAFLSTVFGTRPFRLVPNPTYERQCTYWWAAEIQRVCDELRRHLPDACRNIETPHTYWDLYKYFDAWDIYYRGAQNLWNVINTLVFENQYARGLVEKEQKMQTEQNMPLFEFFAAELLKKPGMQYKLFMWDQENQPDILQFLTTHELQMFFEGFEKYPDHFVEAIRGIFKKHHYSFREGFTLDHYLNSIGRQDIDIPKQLAALRRHLEQALDDPFMDKFDIPNRIVNGIVIVDGTSATAARKAGYKPSNISPHNSIPQKAVQDNNANGPPSTTEVLPEDASPCPRKSPANDFAPRCMIERCSSAPNLGTEPPNTINHSVDKAPVYRVNGQEADKPTECEESANQKDPRADTQNVVNLVQPATHAPNGDLQQISPIMNQTLPPTQHHHNPSQVNHRPSPSNWKPIATSSTFIPSLPPSSQPPEARDCGVSSGAFANQIPTYALSEQHVQGPSPVMQQGYYSGPGAMQPNGGGNTMNSPPPYVQAGPRQQYNKPPTFSEGPGSFRKHKRNHSTKNSGSGRWQHVGSDNIHGPKVVFRKDSVHSQESRNHRAGQWQSKESNESDRRNSTTSTRGGYQRFSNTLPHQYNGHTGPHQAQRGVTVTRSSSQAPEMAGHLIHEYGCVNSNKPLNLWTKFDPCSCKACHDRDRSIFVGRLKYGTNQNKAVAACLKQHFSRYGEIDDIRPAVHNSNAVYIRFSTSEAAVAAVQGGSRVKISDLEGPDLLVHYRIGSQFTIPRGSKPKGRHAHSMPQEQPAPMPQPLNIGPSNFSGHSQPFQHHPSLPREPVVTPGSTAPEGYSPGIHPTGATEHAFNLLDRAATQSGFWKGAGGCYKGLGSPNISWQPPQCHPQTDVKGAYGMASHNPQHGSQFDRMMPHSHEANAVQPGHNIPQAATTHSDFQGNFTGLPKNGDSGKLEDASRKYTARIRPRKPQHMPIPPQWRQENALPHPMNEFGPQIPQISPQSGQAPTAKFASPSTSEGSRQMRTPGGDITTESQHKDNRGKIPSEDVHLNKHPNINSHPKRKASEKDGNDEIPGQSSQKVAKATQSDNPSHGTRGSQSEGNQDNEAVAIQTKASKKKKKANKNKGPRLEAPENADANVPYQTPTFQPAIAASSLPPYPQQPTRDIGAELDSFHISPPVFAWSPADYGNQRSNENEPFPPYQDAIFGPQLPRQGHKGSATRWGPNQSVSSVASTIIGDSSHENNGGKVSAGEKQGGGKGKGKGNIGKPRRFHQQQTYAPPITDGELQAQNNSNAEASKHGQSVSRDPNTTPPPPTTATASTISTPGTSSKPKQGKAKNRAAYKKGVGSQPTAENVNAENTPSKGANTPSKGVGTNKPAQDQAKGKPQSQAPPSNPKPVINADEFPALPSRPVPALAPIPLPFTSMSNPWQRAGKSASALNSMPKPNGPKDGESVSREKGPPSPSGERKGG